MNHCSARLTLTTVLLSAALTWPAASGQPEPVDPDHAAKMAKGLDLFKKHVRPVLVQSCLKCHGGKDTEGEFDLSDRPALMRGGASGPAVLLGKGRDSLLYKLVTHTKEPPMPFNSKKLANDAVARIAEWIDLGAPYDKPLVEGRRTAAWTEKVVADDARQFWSFQTLQRAALPPVKHADWVRTPLDRFILAKQEAAGVAPNPLVDRRLLIRRAYFDLIGLPPTPEETEAFLTDPRPDAYERLVDRLLNSPHYGERWGRHWLDLARFAESHGFEHDYDRPSAYHYRDFVIRALNADLPYNTFIKWQLAGDEYEPENNLALTATGFLAAGVHSTQITKKEVEKHRYDELDDKLATVGTAFLGLTLGCARCHDHKYDAIPQRDYYRLVSTFTTTVRSEIDLNLDREGHKKALAAFEREHEPFVAALRRFEYEQLPPRLAEWEKSWPARREQFPWSIVEPLEAQSTGGTTFTKLGDGSLLAGGKNPDHDVYTFIVHTRLTGITALRLEALAHPSLVKGGPGRAKNGNFALTDLQVFALPVSGRGKPLPLRLKNPRATFEQKGLPVAAAIDGKPQSGWAIDSQIGKDHAAAFDLETPAGFEEGTLLTINLLFSGNSGHGIGRPRLALTTAPQALPLTAAGVPEQVRTLLDISQEQRRPADVTALLQWYRALDPEWRTLDQKLQAHLAKAPKPHLVKALIATEGLPAVRLHTQGGDFLNETHFLRRGDPDQKEGVAAQGFLQVLMQTPKGEKHWQTQPPQGVRNSYRRRALAEWLTDTEQGAGQLLARVIVNRLWQHHLGRGIVATPSDFGVRGEKPTHPELLDWLATELLRNGWRLKPIHKLILTSAVYMESSQGNAASARLDPENRLFWRRPARRLEAEVIRDALLAVSGTLDDRLFGPGTLDPSSRRRSIYFTVKRSKLVPMMQVFDAPDALGGIGERPTTTIAPQALYLMNNANVRGYAKTFAQRIAPDPTVPLTQAVTAAYWRALVRLPNTEELDDALAFLGQQMESYRAAGRDDGRAAALMDFCQALLCLNEFVYVD